MGCTRTWHSTAAMRRFTVAACAAIVLLPACASASSATAASGVAAWGENRFEQLGGFSGKGKSTVPLAVPALGDGIAAISANLWHGMALTSDGHVLSWGRFCKLGEICPQPVEEVAGLSGVKAISAGVYYDLALLDDGRVMAWGNNDYGELGDGTIVASEVPVEVSGLQAREVRAIAAGYYQGLALLRDGTVMTWGDNESGQLGIGESTGPETCTGGAPCSTVPLAVPGLTGATGIAAGWWHDAALLSDGRVVDWGRNTEGQLGTGSFAGPESCEGQAVACSADPVEVAGLREVTAIAAGAYHALALQSSGKVVAWGKGGEGQLGNGARSDSDVPVAVSGLEGVRSVSGGEQQSLALLGGGGVMAWGENAHGQLGDGRLHSSDVPVPTLGLAGATAIAAGGDFGLAAGPAESPQVSGVSPKTGPVGGGATVTISGSALREATAVSFGATAAASFSVNSHGSITALSPGGASGGVDITVTTPNGTSTVSPHDRYRFKRPE